MKTIKNCALLLFLFSISTISAQINTPMPSPKGSVSSAVGLTDVTIDYFRPKKKGREIFGSSDSHLVKYGSIWRTGANSGTKLTLSTDVTIGGEKVKAGSYLVFTTPNVSSWDFMLYSDLELGGNVNGYDKAKEVLKISVAPNSNQSVIENLTFNISDISEDNTKANIYFAWDNISWKVPVEVDFDEMVMKEIEDKTQVNYTNYVQAANYYLATDKDLDQAIEWMDMYLAKGENSNQFWHLHTKAKILAKKGMKKEAIAVAKDSLDKAKSFAQGDFGYIKRNEDLIASLKKDM